MNEFLQSESIDCIDDLALCYEEARLWEEESTGSEENETWQYTE